MNLKHNVIIIIIDNLWLISKGIVSFGPQPCGSGYGVYTNLSKFAEFISNVSSIYVEPKPTSSTDNCCSNINLESDTIADGNYLSIENGTANSHLVGDAQAMNYY